VLVVSTIVLWVSDLNKSVEYYKDLFLAEAPYVSKEFASVRGLGNEVLLHLLPEEYRAEPSYGELNPIKPVFSIDSIERAREVANNHGTTFKSEVMEHNGVNYLDGTDPDGHVIQIAVS